MNIDSFLETALWSTTDFDGNNLDDSMYSDKEVSEEFKTKCQQIMDDFLDKARPYFTEDELENSPIEHDLWLTIHHHGAGFWDGDYENGDKLTEIAQTMSELEDELRDELCN